MTIFKLENQSYIVIGWAALVLAIVLLLPDGAAKTAVGVVGFGLLIVGWPILNTLAHKNKWGVSKDKRSAKVTDNYFTNWKNLLFIAAFTWLPCIAYAALFNAKFGMAFAIGAFVFLANVVKDFVEYNQPSK